MNEKGGSTPRSKTEIISILNSAKLNEADFLQTTQVLYINEANARNDQHKLLELDKNLLMTLRNNETVVFKGSDNQSVVLCTDCKTYDVRECETSNSLLLVPGLKFADDLKQVTSDANEDGDVKQLNVMGINYRYLEVIPIKPRFDKITKLLGETTYKGPELEFEYNESQLMTFDELLSVTQASRTELETFLKNKCDVITVNNKIRLLDLAYHFRVFSFLLKSIDENSWSLDAIDREESVRAWCDVAPKEVLEEIFNLYGEESKCVDGKILYKYNEVKVCQFFAKVLLSYAGKFNLKDFLQAWRESVPEGMTVQEEMLHGIALIDRVSKPQVIWTFTETNLPNTIPERFAALFTAKPKWTASEITPYISGLTNDKMDASALLAKYARASTVDGVRYYSSKYNCK